jgi:hypothetical protein
MLTSTDRLLPSPVDSPIRFALRQLTALNDERGRLVRAELDHFSAGREIDPAIERRWRFT